MTDDQIHHMLGELSALPTLCDNPKAYDIVRKTLSQVVPLSDRVRRHLDRHGPCTARHVANALDEPLPRVAASIQSLLKRGDCIGEHGERKGQPHRPESTYVLTVALPPEPDTQATASFAALTAAWQ